MSTRMKNNNLQVQVPLDLFCQAFPNIDAKKDGEKIAGQLEGLISYIAFKGNEVEAVKSLKEKTIEQRLQEAREKRRVEDE